MSGKRERVFTLICRNVARCLELLYRHVRVFRKEDDVPVVVAHGRRTCCCQKVQKSNKQEREGDVEGVEVREGRRRFVVRELEPYYSEPRPDRGKKEGATADSLQGHGAT